jgi:hypothetical protein
MCDSSFSADFFNNVAAVAVVLIFTKVLTHRSRKAKNAANDTPLLSQLHVGAVVLAAVAVGISLWATGFCQTNTGMCIVAASALGLTGLLLIFDVVIEERSASDHNV